MAESVVFVVANDARYRRSIARALAQSTGLHAVSMRGGSPALDWARAAHPALIVVDDARPDMDGCAMLRQLKAHPDTETIPVLVMSGHGPDGHDEARAAGCDGFISKPFAAADLAEVVRHCLAQAHRTPAGASA